jgi:parallel beta-helix repeat protein
LSAGVHDGPLLLDHAQKLVGEPGAVVRGGIVITADDVTVRDVAILAEENGITVEGAIDVELERVRVSGATLDGVNVTRGSVTIRDCVVDEPGGQYTQGIDISFSFDLPPSRVEGCRIAGGQEGIVSNSARVLITDNHVTGTTIRGISVNEMSMSTVEENTVANAVGVGIFCSDYSHCHIERNSVSQTRPDMSSGDGTRMGYAIVALFHAEAVLRDNELEENHRGTLAFADARIFE